MLGNFGALKIWIPELGFSVFFRNLSPDWRYVCFPTSCIYKSGHSGLKMDTSTRGSADADLTVCVTNTSDSPLGTLWSTQQTFRIKAVWLIWYGNTNTLNVSLFAKKTKKSCKWAEWKKGHPYSSSKDFFPFLPLLGKIFSWCFDNQGSMTHIKGIGGMVTGIRRTHSINFRLCWMLLHTWAERLRLWGCPVQLTQWWNLSGKARAQEEGAGFLPRPSCCLSPAPCPFILTPCKAGPLTDWDHPPNSALRLSPRGWQRPC